MIPSTVVTSDHISKLWSIKVSNETGFRSTHHISKSCVTPFHYEKMNVGLAFWYLSLKTASSLEMEVTLKILPLEALTTAWFIRFLNEWFILFMSKSVKTSLTKKFWKEVSTQFFENCCWNQDRRFWMEVIIYRLLWAHFLLCGGLKVLSIRAMNS